MADREFRPGIRVPRLDVGARFVQDRRRCVVTTMAVDRAPAELGARNGAM